jgi:hypothetical protein
LKPLFSLFLLGTAFLGAASGQQIGFSGPVEGYTFDPPTASLRAVAGFPGAASFGPALLSGLEFGSAAPQQNYAVAFQDGNCVLVTSLDSGVASTTPIPAAVRRPDGIAWSADGSVAVLYSRAASWLQTLSLLPGNPTAGNYIDLSSLGGSLTAVAVDGKGQQVAIALGGSAAGLYLMTASESFTPVLQLSNPVALSFSNDGTQLFAIDAASVQLAVVSLAGFHFQMAPLDGLADPFALREAADQKLYVASRSDRRLREFDLSSLQAVADLTLSFTPTGIEQFGPNSFLVGSRTQATDPMWLLTNAAQPAAYFVPAIPQVIGLGRGADPAPAPISPGKEGHAR